MAIHLKNNIRFLPLLLWASVIFYMSSQDAIGVSDSRTVDIFVHKLAHIIEYAILYITFYIAFAHRIKNAAATGILFTMLYGISDEIHQSYNPTRSPRYYDVLIDTLGGCAGYIVILLFKKLRHRIT